MRAAPRLALHRDRAAALLHDAIDGREPQPRALALLLRGEERLEEVAAHVLVHADPGVADNEPDTGALAGNEGGGLDGERPAARHRVAGVHGEVHDGELELPGVSQQRRKTVRVAGLQDEVLSDETLEHALDAADELVQVDRPGLRRLLTAEAEQLPDQRSAPVDRLPDFRDPAAALGVHPPVQQEHFRESGDRGQQVAEIVGDAPGEPADCLHLLTLVKLLLHPLLTRDVGYYAREARRFVTLGQRVAVGSHVQRRAVGADDPELVGLPLPPVAPGCIPAYALDVLRVDELLERSPHEFGGLPPRHPLHGRADVGEPAFAVEAEDDLVNAVHHPAILLFGRAQGLFYAPALGGFVQQHNPARRAAATIGEPRDLDLEPAFGCGRQTHVPQPGAAGRFGGRRQVRDQVGD